MRDLKCENDNGFTLFEILVASSVMILVTGFGLATWTRFRERSLVEVTASKIASELQVVRSNAVSGNKPNGCQSLDGYYVWKEGVDLIYAPYCEGEEFPNFRKTIEIPSSLDKVFSGSFMFESLTGNVGAAASVEIIYNNLAKTVNVSASGEISVSDFLAVICRDHQSEENEACVCDSGYADCDGNSENGCEVDLSSNTANCGSCANNCSLGIIHGSGVCVDGDCEIGSCTAGWGNCNGQDSDDCEMNLMSDMSNCGACGSVCPSSGFKFSSANCIGGVCQLWCNADYGDCDGNVNNGCETILTTNFNCGTCGNICGINKTCVDGICI